MCLTVTHVPANLATHRVTRCWKWLSRNVEGRFITPYMCIVIPSNGWLFPHRQTKSKFILDTNINGGVIHAYCDNKQWSEEEAYAFGVEAFDLNDPAWGREELVCRALYIPCCDTTNSNTLEVINSLPYGVSKAHLLKKLPILKRIESHLR
jgi:hypothetical protein